MNVTKVLRKFPHICFSFNFKREYLNLYKTRNRQKRRSAGELGSWRSHKKYCPCHTVLFNKIFNFMLSR